MPRYERMRAALLSFHALETRGGCPRLTPDPALFDADLCFTARAQDDGSVRFHHDVYGRSESMDDQAEERKAPARAARLEETDAAAGGPTATRQSSGRLPATGARPHAPRRTSAGR